MIMKEKEVMIKGSISIGATISYPDDSRADFAQKYPAVVLIMGTGKTDRDGNEKSFKTDLYKNFAKMFAQCGFVSVRYDKRGTYKIQRNFNTAGLQDLVDDAVSVIRYTKSLPYVDEESVIVCGHSEGAMIATLLSAKEDTAGLLLLGGAATCMKDALLYQNYLAAEEFAKKKGLLGMLLRSQTSQEKTDAKVDAMFQKCISTKKDRVFFSGAMLNAKWVKEHASYCSEDYVTFLEQYGKPILSVTGTADISADYRRLSALHDIPLAESYTPRNVNHILREIDDDNSLMTVKKQYRRLAEQPIHEETKQKIYMWLSAFKAVEKRDKR